MPLVTLTPAEHDQLRALARAGRESLARRARIILAAAGDTSAGKVARAVGAAEGTVRHWLARFGTAGIEGLHDAPRTGAPRRIGPGARAEIAALGTQGLSTRAIARRAGASQTSVARILAGDRPSAPPAPPLPGDLVQALFESLTEERPLVRFLRLLKEATDSAFGTFLVFSRKGRKPALIVTEAERLVDAVRYYEEFYRKEIMADIPEGIVVTASDLLPGDRLRNTPLYQEYLKPLGIGHIIGVDVATAHGVSGSLRLSRLETAHDFGPRTRALCQALIPYLRAALELFVQRADTETERAALQQTISGMSVGRIHLAPDSRILTTSPPAAAMLAERDGLQDSGGHLVLASATATRRLRALVRHNALASIDASVAAEIRALRVERPSGKESYNILVRPLGHPHAPGREPSFSIRPTATVQVVDPAGSYMKRAPALMQLFGLTAAEADVALALASGRTVDAIAALRETSVETVRSQLRTIFAKTGSNRQTALVRTLYLSIALFDLDAASGDD